MCTVLAIEPESSDLALRRGDQGCVMGVAIGFANSVEDALKLAQEGKCDTLLISAALPEEHTLEIVKSVSQTEPHVTILIKDLADAHRTAAPYIAAGAAGWLL